MIKTQKINGIEVFSCHPAQQTSRPPLLFVHGAFAGGWMWTDTFMPYLAQAGYPCHALSLRGHGGSDGHEHIDWLSIADYVEDVAGVIDWLGERVVLSVDTLLLMVICLVYAFASDVLAAPWDLRVLYAAYVALATELSVAFERIDTLEFKGLDECGATVGFHGCPPRCRGISGIGPDRTGGT